MTAKKEKTSKAKVAKEETPKSVMPNTEVSKETPKVEDAAPKESETQTLKTKEKVEQEPKQETPTKKSGEEEGPGEEPVNQEDDENKFKGYIGLTYEEAIEAMEVGNFISVVGSNLMLFKQISNPEKTYALDISEKVISEVSLTVMSLMKGYLPGYIIVAPSEDQDDILADFWEKKNQEDQSIKDHAKLLSMKVKAYNRAKETTFIKLNGSLTYEELVSRTNLPNDASRDSQFILADGTVYDLESGSLTNRNEKDLLKQLK